MFDILISRREMQQLFNEFYLLVSEQSEPPVEPAVQLRLRKQLHVPADGQNSSVSC